MSTSLLLPTRYFWPRCFGLEQHVQTPAVTAVHAVTSVGAITRRVPARPSRIVETVQRRPKRESSKGREMTSKMPAKKPPSLKKHQLSDRE
jgi:hypothetical protein